MINEKKLNKAIKDKQEAAYSPRQDYPAYDAEQQRRTDNRNQRDRDNYDNYRDYPNSTGRY